MRASALLASAVLLASPTHAQQFGSTEQFFPQIALDGGATTVFTTHNPNEEMIQVRIELNRPDGSRILALEVDLGPGATSTVRLVEICGPLNMLHLFVPKDTN